jgi:hypothetical protein
VCFLFAFVYDDVLPSYALCTMVFGPCFRESLVPFPDYLLSRNHSLTLFESIYSINRSEKEETIKVLSDFALGKGGHFGSE